MTTVLLACIALTLLFIGIVLDDIRRYVRGLANPFLADYIKRSWARNLGKKPEKSNGK